LNTETTEEEEEGKRARTYTIWYMFQRTE